MQSSFFDLEYEKQAKTATPLASRMRPTNLDGFVVYYTPNMDEKLKQTVVTEMPRITKQIMAWHPSTPTPEPMYLLLAAGGGGGWAVNAYKPKENGIISTDIEGLIGIYAHELAHTLGGPANAKGEKAGTFVSLESLGKEIN